MNVVLAAVDASPAARPVVEAAIRIAELTDTTTELVHVDEADGAAPDWLAARFGLTLHLLPGPVEESLQRAVAQPSVVVAVIGARGTPHGRRPAGRTAMHLIAHATKPVVVVPPDMPVGAERWYRRLLLPLDGDPASSRAVSEQLAPLLAREVELRVLHVLTAATAPRALDRPDQDLQLWRDEFVARFCPEASHLEVRTGCVGAEVARVAEEEDVDVVVVSWSQDFTGGRASAIRDLLAHSHVPVLMLPLARRAAYT